MLSCGLEVVAESGLRGSRRSSTGGSLAAPARARARRLLLLLAVAVVDIGRPCVVPMVNVDGRIAASQWDIVGG
jgi:hypothetical protein